MILIAHITVALLSILSTSMALISPTKRKLVASYALATATLGTGIGLVLTLDSGVLRACVAGISYFALVSVGIFFAQRKYVFATERSTK